MIGKARAAVAVVAAGSRGLSTKRSLALREFALGIESLDDSFAKYRRGERRGFPTARLQLRAKEGGAASVARCQAGRASQSAWVTSRERSTSASKARVSRAAKSAADDVEVRLVVEAKGAVVEIRRADRSPQAVDDHRFAVIHRRLELEDAHAALRACRPSDGATRRAPPGNPYAGRARALRSRRRAPPLRAASRS